MLLIPAIDLKDGRCVRLRQGRLEDVTVFSDDPVATTRHWLTAGCRRLHVVDLDGAVSGEPRNASIIAAIVAAAEKVPVQVGGGVRSFPTIDAYREAGAAQVIIGTQAVRDPAFFEEACRRYPGRIVLGIDARHGRVATEGWQQTSSTSATELARWGAAFRPFAIVYTEIARDGMLSGLDVDGTLVLAEQCQAPVIASGGVGSVADLERLARAARGRAARLMGVIAGRALYTGALDFPDAQAVLDEAGD